MQYCNGLLKIVFYLIGFKRLISKINELIRFYEIMEKQKPYKVLKTLQDDIKKPQHFCYGSIFYVFLIYATIIINEIKIKHKTIIPILTFHLLSRIFSKVTFRPNQTHLIVAPIFREIFFIKTHKTSSANS